MIDDFVAGIGTRPRSWQGKDGQHPLLFERPKWRNKAEALSYPLISHSNPAMVTGVAMDIDDPDARHAWRRLGLPEPNLIMVNPANGHAHYWFQFEKPVNRHTQEYLDKNGPSKTWKFYEALRRGMRAAYRCDPAYNEEMVKNPLHSKWKTIVGRNTPYLMNELYAHPVIRQFMRYENCRVVEDDRGRNCSIYRSTMIWMIRNRYRFPDEIALRNGIRQAVYDIWSSLTHPDGRLPEQELPHIINSVCKTALMGSLDASWFKNRGAAGVDPVLPLVEKQRLGQAYTAHVRVEKTLYKLRSAYEKVMSKDGIVRKSVVAEIANVSVATVYRLWSQLIELMSKAIADSAKVVSTDYNKVSVPLSGQYLKHPVRTIEPGSILNSHCDGIEEANRLIQAIIRGEITRFDTPPERSRHIFNSECDWNLQNMGFRPV